MVFPLKSVAYRASVLECFGVFWSAVGSVSATPLSEGGDWERRLSSRRIFHARTPSESGVADARALPSHLCHRTPKRCRVYLPA